VSERASEHVDEGARARLKNERRRELVLGASARPGQGPGRMEGRGGGRGKREERASG
jgi:hypothetical protein